MYHLRFKGAHYEIGKRWGSRLRANGFSILSNVPFAITEERVAFGRKCLPHYERHFPEILDEIRGISDGQQISFDSLIAVLFTMYCIVPSAHCSCFAAKSANGVILGRNSDFLISIERLCMNTKYKFVSGSYSFNGNTTAFVEMEDGINEHGLAVGLTSVAPKVIRPGLNAGMILRLFLEKCKCVADAVTLLQSLPIASSQTFIAADKAGNAALIECAPAITQIKHIDSDCSYVCSTNMFNLPEMKDENNLPEDAWFAEERYQTMAQFLCGLDANMTVPHAQELLGGYKGFICQYDRKSGKDTVWSVIYDVSQGSIYRCEGNPARSAFSKDMRR